MSSLPAPFWRTDIIRSAALFAAPLLSLICAAPCHAQSSADLIFPTDEELFEALDAGLISFSEYLTLLDAFNAPPASVADSVALLRQLGADFPALELITGAAPFDSAGAEQLEALTVDETHGADFTLHYRAYVDQELTDQQRGRGLNLVRLSHGSDWRFRGSIGNSYTQPAVWKSRTLTYYPPHSPVTEITLGNLDLRPALGLALGRRGRLVDRPPALAERFTLKTDRSGLDGVTVAGGTRSRTGVGWRGVFSRRTDSTVSLQMTAAELNRHFDRVTIGAVVTRGELSAQGESGRFRQWQFSQSLDWRRSAGRVTVEVNTQVNDRTVSTAAALEARARLEVADIRAALWRYPAGYRNLFGSGRAGAVYETVALSEQEFTFSERRVDQTGASIRARTRTLGSLRFRGDIDLARNGAGEERAEARLALQRDNLPLGELSFEIGARRRRHDGVNLEQGYLRAQVSGSRASARWRVAVRALRSEDHARSFGLFARLRRTFADNTSVELWADLSRWEPQRAGIRRFYGFLRFLAPVNSGGQLRLASKLAYRYDADAGARSRIVVRLELEALW